MSGNGKPRMISSTECFRSFGAVMDEVRTRNAVIVANHGRPQVAVMAIAEYEALVRDAERWRRRLLPSALVARRAGASDEEGEQA